MLVMCSAKKNTAGETKAKAQIQYKDDFRAASDKEKAALIKKLKANADNYSVLIFTNNFKGEKITASNSKGRLYSGYPMSNLKTGIAESIRIDNTLDTRIYDNLTKQEAIVEAGEAKKTQVHLPDEKSRGEASVRDYV